MSFDLDENAGSNSIYPTKLDETRIRDAQIGETILSENGNFQVLIYKDSYVLLLSDYKKGPAFQDFESFEKLMKFLKKN